MDRQRNRRIFAGFYRRYDGKYIYVVAVVSDADTDEKIMIFHYGTETCGCKYYTMTKKSFCEQAEVNGEWVDKFTRQPQVKITDTHISNLEKQVFPVLSVKSNQRMRKNCFMRTALTAAPKHIPIMQRISAKTINRMCVNIICALHKNGISAFRAKRILIYWKKI